MKLIAQQSQIRVIIGCHSTDAEEIGHAGLAFCHWFTGAHWTAILSGF